MMEIKDLTTVLQASIAPCVLLSGFGFLLLSMTNRLGRATDRIRALNSGLKAHHTEGASGDRKQILILFHRCKLLQASVTFLTLSIIMVAVIVFMLFLTLTTSISLADVIKFCFITSLLSLIVSLVLFLWDIRITLNSIKIEINC